MSDTSDALNDLIAVLIDGQTFYTKAAEKVEDPNLKQFFFRMAELRDTAVIALRPFVLREGEQPADDGTLAGAARRFYADSLSIVTDTDRTFIGQLEEHEDRVLEMIKEAQEEASNAEIRAVLFNQRTAFQQTHDTMRDLKKAA